MMARTVVDGSAAVGTAEHFGLVDKTRGRGRWCGGHRGGVHGRRQSEERGNDGSGRRNVLAHQGLQDAERQSGFDIRWQTSGTARSECQIQYSTSV